MNLTVIILCAIIIVLLIFVVVLLIGLKGKSDDIDDLRRDFDHMLNQTRDDILNNLGTKINENGNTQYQILTNLTQINEQKLDNTRKSTEEKLEKIRETVEGRLLYMQKDNAEKLEKVLWANCLRSLG
mgnify:FL=1